MTSTRRARAPLLIPAALTLAYPYLLRAFSATAGAPNGPHTALESVAGWACLAAAISVPLVGFVCAYAWRDAHDGDGLRARARSLAFLMTISPPLYVFIGVARGFIGRPLTDEAFWLAFWGIAIVALIFLDDPGAAPAASPAPSRLRVAHGVSASLILLFVTFHLFNHLTGLLGPDTHKAVMKAGRTVYRFPVVEPILVGLLLFQVAGGIALAARWRHAARDGFRVLQVASGLYLSSFIVAHLNSALVGARAIRHIETDWAWAAGAPRGLLHDAWNVRLIPHYGWGVFFVLVHLLLGLRQVLLEHKTNERLVTRLVFAGAAGSAVTACAIMAGLLGARL